jgi:hypothetical protein
MSVLRTVIQRAFNQKALIEIIAILFMSMFIYTALSKWSDYSMSREQMALMPLITPFAHIIIWLLPTTEIAISVLLYFSKTKKLGFYLATILMILFTLYIINMMVFYSKLPCSCGGFLNELSWPNHLIFNSVYILLGITAILLSRRKEIKTKDSSERYYSLAQ